jgi:hypothetical protein
VKVLTDRTSSKAQKVNSAASLMAGATMVYIAWEISDALTDLAKKGYNLAEEVTDEAIEFWVDKADEALGRNRPKETDLPFEVQTAGRLEVPGTKGSKFLRFDPEEALWFRFLDVPYLGDVMMAREILGGQYSPIDYINDRISQGPGFNIAAAWLNLSDQYNEGQPRAYKMGKATSQLLPFSPMLIAGRRFSDVLKRERGKETDEAYRNYFRAIADDVPVLSMMLDERLHRGGAEFERYPRSETFMSYFILNGRVVDEVDREAGIAMAYAVAVEDLNQEIDEDIMRGYIRALMDAEGQTEAGRIKEVARTDQQELELRLARAVSANRLRKALQLGGVDAMNAEYQKIMAELESTPEMMESVRRSLSPVKKKYERIEEKGLEEHVIKSQPVRLQDKLREEIEK